MFQGPGRGAKQWESMDPLISQAELAQFLRYDGESGNLYWKIKKGSKSKDAIAGSIGNCGYLDVRFKRRLYRAHRLAWILHHGEPPPPGMDIDHINGNRLDNRASNLRLATRQQNNGNAGLSKANTSGHKGVVWFKRDARWRAQITVDRVCKHLGYFASKEDAVEAYRKASLAAFGDHSSHARPDL